MKEFYEAENEIEVIIEQQKYVQLTPCDEDFNVKELYFVKRDDDATVYMKNNHWQITAYRNLSIYTLNNYFLLSHFELYSFDKTSCKKLLNKKYKIFLNEGMQKSLDSYLSYLTREMRNYRSHMNASFYSNVNVTLRITFDKETHRPIEFHIQSNISIHRGARHLPGISYLFNSMALFREDKLITLMFSSRGHNLEWDHFHKEGMIQMCWIFFRTSLDPVVTEGMNCDIESSKQGLSQFVRLRSLNKMVKI